MRLVVVGAKLCNQNLKENDSSRKSETSRLKHYRDFIRRKVTRRH